MGNCPNAGEVVSPAEQGQPGYRPIQDVIDSTAESSASLPGHGHYPTPRPGPGKQAGTQRPSAWARPRRRGPPQGMSTTSA